MTSGTPILRRRPLSTKNPSIEHGSSPGHVATPPRQTNRSSPHRAALSSTLRYDQVIEDTPSPLRELERGWKEIRRNRLGIPQPMDGDETAIQLRHTQYEQSQNPKNIDEEHQKVLRGDRMRQIDSYDGIKRNVRQRNKDQVNVRFVTSSSSALLTPPQTPPESPKSPHVHLSSTINEQSEYPPPNSMTVGPRLSTAKSAFVKSPILPNQAHKEQPFTRKALQPILSYPLPPTSHPVPIQKNKKDTIYIPSQPSSYEMILYLVGGRIIKVKKGGSLVDFTTEDSMGKVRERTLYTSRAEQWDEEDRRDWKNLRGVVEGFKRITPRSPLTPPDFRNDKMETSELSSRTESTKRVCKVRLVYSRSIRELRLDTASTNVLREEKIRTRRIVRISRQVGSTSMKEQKTRRQDDFEGICRYFSLDTELLDWKEEEKEALRTLWALRDEWVRWDGG
ncbi:hypothetical protein L486_06097 [Kwoniella mangroviensis CBS 10435]|uniref:Uncharacterized protein n=1 Tax=Kwoniella mangroviensis CBS 10435 TaxID=1331196 RepID=A0A1B9IKI9_9TREE|nr:uncharacterized protein I203_05803 [Kwoniella mangroviensis CBS 8507]OCF56156.1 hypothetical protein L486_06097 [Kwoniella mangroviensis CBS 10435]OCF65061.1 hypothetical protein I203_05803 [Kwoniella mangroviensis CBS 8507]OCF78905.1 hypothetical protein I204_00849 [Kwoniella mangroviensis CBS 8886]